jgi:hypothetical protein
LLVSLVLIVACGSGNGTGSAVTRDSAGISIVENSGGQWAAGKGWVVVDSPSVDLGGPGGEPSSEVDGVAGPVRLTDGRFAIANGGTKEVRIYSATGKHEVSSGREGSGPGEFRMLAGIWSGPGDSLLVFDAMAQRLSVLGPDGTFGRTFRLGGGAGPALPTNGRFEFALPQGWSADGSVVGVSQVFAINSASEAAYRDSVWMYRYGADGVVRDTLGRFPGIEMAQMKLTIQGQSISAPNPVPLGKQSVSVVGGTRFYIALNNSSEIEVRDLEGKLLSLIRLGTKPTPITPADIELHRKETIEATESAPQVRNLPQELKDQITAGIRAAQYPATLPFFSSLHLDADQNLWAHEVTRPAVKEQQFAVLDPGGRLLGRVTMPARFSLTGVGRDIVYGVWKDQEDVEHLRVYPLRKE